MAGNVCPARLLPCVLVPFFEPELLPHEPDESVGRMFHVEGAAVELVEEDPPCG